MKCSVPGFLSFTISWSPLNFMSISSSATPFSFCLPSFIATGFFPMSQFFTSGGQSTGASASATDLPVNIQGRFPLGLTGLISLQGILKTLLQHHNSKALLFAVYCWQCLGLIHSLIYSSYLKHLLCGWDVSFISGE